VRGTGKAAVCDGIHERENGEIAVDVEHEDHFSWGVPLDEAERLLGLDGKEE